MSISKIEEINKKFDEKVNEIRQQLPQSEADEKIVEFGYKTIRGNEFFNVVDFGNIKKFWNKQILSLIEELIGEDEETKKHTDIITDPAGALLNHHRLSRNTLRSEMRASIKSLVLKDSI